MAFGEGLEGAKGLIGEEKGIATISPLGVRVEGDSRARNDNRGVLRANVFAEASLEVAMLNRVDERREKQNSPFLLPTPHLIYSSTTQITQVPPQRPTMTNSTLPEELLVLILSPLSQNELYHAALACKAFCAITQPLLYPCVVIKAKSQIEQLKAAKEDDKSRIESVTFVAEANITSNGDFDALMVVFRTEAATILDRAKEGCIRELFAGVVLPLDCTSFLCCINKENRN